MIGFLAGLAAWAGAAAFGSAELTAIDAPLPTSDAADFAEATAAFDARVRALHPPGGEAEGLRRALEDQGFERLATSPEAGGWLGARLETSELFCAYDWTVLWVEEEGRIADIAGEVGGSCL